MALYVGFVLKKIKVNEGPFTYRRPSKSLKRCRPLSGA